MHAYIIPSPRPIYPIYLSSCPSWSPFAPFCTVLRRVESGGTLELCIVSDSRLYVLRLLGASCVDTSTEYFALSRLRILGITGGIATSELTYRLSGPPGPLLIDRESIYQKTEREKCLNWPGRMSCVYVFQSQTRRLADSPRNNPINPRHRFLTHLNVCIAATQHHWCLSPLNLPASCTTYCTYPLLFYIHHCVVQETVIFFSPPAQTRGLNGVGDEDTQLPRLQPSAPKLEARGF